MIPRHLPLLIPPARRGGPARPCASSVFSVISATFVFIPALSPKNLSFVFIRLRTLSFSVYNIFPFKRFAFNPFRTLSIAMGVEGYFFRIRKAMRTPRSAAPRGLSNFVSRYACFPLSTFNPQPLYLPTFFLLLLSFPLSSEVSLCRPQP